MSKYDHAVIMRLHKAGISVSRIAEIVGAKHEMTIKCIIRKETNEFNGRRIPYVQAIR